MGKWHTLEECHRIAEERGGKCLSDKYVDCDSPMIWQCKEGHVWENRFIKILKGQWCKICHLNNYSEDLRGRRFGRLVVEDLVEPNCREKWTCRCDCGNTHIATSGNLKKGIRSCGCINKKYSNYNKNITREEKAYDRYYFTYKSNASRKNKEFNISKIDFLNIIKQPCHYCGENSRKWKYGEIYIEVNGLDRLDFKIGYTLENVVPCCPHCNYMKLKDGIDEFKNQIIKIYNYLKLDKKGE